jgi:hypothetical protein
VTKHCWYKLSKETYMLFKFNETPATFQIFVATGQIKKRCSCDS